MMKPILIAAVCIALLSGCTGSGGFPTSMPAAPAFSCDTHAIKDAEPCSNY
jgi:hypothetical protein